MIKKYTIRTIVTLVISWILPQIHRIYNNFPIKIIHPFPYAKQVEISTQWYVKDLGDLSSFSLLMVMVYMVLIPVRNHLKEAQWVGHNRLLNFVTLWHRLFLIIIIASIFDIVHYILAFRQLEWYFLILNGGYLVMSLYYIQKLWKR